MTTLTPTPKQQFLDANGNPLAGGKVYTYAAGTTTPLVTYTDEGGTTPNSNPVILDSRGEAAIWLGVASYKLKLTTSTDVEIWTVDNIISANSEVLADLAASGGSALVGFLQSGTGAVATTVQTKLRETVSVKDFGAVGDGVTNDKAAFVAANASGKNIYVPPGDYFVGDGFSITSSGVIWFGAGKDSHITSTGTTGQTILVTGTSDVIFENLRIECTSLSHGPAYGVFTITGGAKNTRINSCYAQGSRYQHFVSPVGLGLSGIWVTNCIVSTVRSLIWVNNACNDITDVWVVNNKATIVYGDGVEFDTPNGTGLTRGYVINNTLIGVADGSILSIGAGFANVHDVVIDGNYIEQFSLRGINVEDKSDVVKIVNNTINNIGYDFVEYPSDQNDGISLFWDIEDIVVSNNTISKAQDSGISMLLGPSNGVLNAKITGNTVSYCGKDNGNGIWANQAGISAQGGSSAEAQVVNRLISGNIVSNCVSHGIRFDGVQRFVVFGGNTLQSNGGYGVNIVGNLLNCLYSDNTGASNTSGLESGYTLNIYVDPVSGNDANFGLSGGTAVKTVSRALSLVSKYIPRNGNVALVISNCTLGQWTENVVVDGYNGEGALTLQALSAFNSQVNCSPTTGDAFTITNNTLVNFGFVRIGGTVTENNKAVFRLNQNSRVFLENPRMSEVVSGAPANSDGIFAERSLVVTNGGVGRLDPATQPGTQAAKRGVVASLGAIVQCQTAPSGFATSQTVDASGGRVFT
jgi:hypothetical protein